MPVGPCEDDPAAPADPQSGTPSALRTFEAGTGIVATTVDGSGNRIITGHFDTTITFGDQVMETTVPDGASFIASLAPDGELSWFHEMHGDSYVHLAEVAVDAEGDVYLSGLYGAQLYLDDQIRSDWTTTGRSPLFVKFDGVTGEVSWLRTLRATDISSDPANILPLDTGEMLVSVALQNGTWTFGNETPFPLGFGVMVTLLDVDGDMVWRVPVEAIANTLTVFTSGLVAVEDGYVGAMFSTTDTGETGMYVDGKMVGNGNAVASYLVRVDADGAVLDADAVAATTSVFVSDIAAAPCSDVILLGTSPSAVDFGGGEIAAGSFALRRTLAGDLRWSFGLPEPGSPKGIVVDAYGQSTLSWFDDAELDHVAKFSAAGEMIWSVTYTTGLPTGGNAAVLLPNGGFVATGSYFGSLEVPPLPSAPGDRAVGSAFMLELSP